MVLRHSLLTSGKSLMKLLYMMQSLLYFICLSTSHFHYIYECFCLLLLLFSANINVHTALDNFAGSFRINGWKGCTSALGRYA
jgi:hypothetical protein